MAEDVVEHIGLFQVVELVGLADEEARWKSTVGQVIEEHVVGHQARHRHHLPAGVLVQHLGHALEVRDLVGPDGQALHALHELVAGTAGQQARLTLEQQSPHRVVLGGVARPALVDRPVGPLGAAGDACGQAMLA